MFKITSYLTILFLLNGTKAEIFIKKSDINFHEVPKISKVSLTQKGYIQFLRYIVDVPPIEDFTFCIWMRSSNLTYTHPLLSYSGHETERYIRAWVTPLGKEIKLAVLEKEIFTVNVGLHEHQWYHICASWSSKSGHWDLFLDGKLRAHGFREKVRGTILPKQGDIVVGQEYTDFDKGLDDGIEGDIFGFNMVLSSTVPSKGPFFSKAPLRRISENRKRISEMQRRMNSGFTVSSPVLILRRKSRKADEYEMETDENPEMIFKINNQNASVAFEDVTNKEFEARNDGFAPAVEIDSIGSFPVRESRVLATNRNKRQNYEFYPMSYSTFNFEPKPPLILQNYEPVYFHPRLALQYASRQPYVTLPVMSPPPRKTSRIANDLLPIANLHQKPLGILLIELSYNCALGKGAPLKNVLISWTKTPVRVFGGAILKKVEPFCLKPNIIVQ